MNIKIVQMLTPLIELAECCVLMMVVISRRLVIVRESTNEQVTLTGAFECDKRDFKASKNFQKLFNAPLRPSTNKVVQPKIMK